MIENLSYKNVITIKEKYKTAGHGPLKVLSDDYVAYVLKFRNNFYDSSSIIKEFLCHYLLKCWEIPTPNISALSVSDEVLKDTNLITLRENKLISQSICFGSELIANSIDINELFEFKRISSQNKVHNLNDIFKIALFDIWIENDDRQPANTNLILDISNDKYTITAIDHASTFSTLEFKELKKNYLNFSYNVSILNSAFAKSIINKSKIDKYFIENYRELFYLCIDNVQKHFNSMCDNIPDNLMFTPEDRTFLKEFLFNNKRNQDVFNEFVYIVENLVK